MKAACRLGTLLALGLLYSTTAWAQLPTAAIRGVATDAQGGVLPGATVTITQKETGLTRTTTTNDVGIYRIAGLPSGTYEVIGELQGFQRRSGVVQLELNQEAELNLSLGVAGTQEAIEVVAQSPIVETTKSEVARTFRSEQIRDLPLAGRNYLNLAFLVPGVTGGASSTGLTQGMGASVNGQRARNVNYIIDGSDNNDASVPNTRAPIIQDAVNEFRIVTSLFSAESGRNNGAIAIASTKSGTNLFHGTAFEFYENGEVLNSRTALDKSAGRTKPGKLRRDTYGFTFGGPLQRDKMFFFGGYQRRPYSAAPSTTPLFSPTQEGRAMLATVPGADPVMLDLINRYLPLPNSSGSQPTVVGGITIPFQQFIGSAPVSEDNDQVIMRVDRNLSATDTIYGRYIYAKTESLNQQATLTPPGFANDQLFPTHNFVATWNRILSSSLLNELHFSFGKTSGAFPGAGDNPAGNNDLSTLTVTSFFTLGIPTNIPQDRLEKVYQFTDNVSFLRGNHSYKFGADIRYVDLVPLVPFDFRGTYTFSTMTEFIRNTPTNLAKAYGNPTLPFRYFETAYYAQDDWKAKSNLTFNLGLRYERVGAAEGFYSNVSTDNNNFAPRIGFAWDVFKEGRTVVRGGYGVAYDQFFLNIPLLAGQAPPFQRRITDATGTTKYPNVPADRDIVGAELLTLNRTDIPDDARAPYSQQYQIGVQRQFGSTWRAEAAYVGSRGLKNIRQRTVNPTICCPRETIIGPTGVPSIRRYGDPQQTGQITSLETSSSSTYHSGQFSVEKRLSGGFSTSVSYTWSRFMDDASESLNTGTPSVQVAQNNFDLDAEWARSSFDRPHRLVVSWMYGLPFWKEQQGVLGRTLGGWQVAGNYSAQSGQPFSIITGVDSNGDNLTTNDRPNPPSGDPKLASSYAPRPAFSGGNGTLGRNSERGPGVNAWNMVFFKNIRTFADHQVQFRAEIFNVFNTPQYSLLTNNQDRNLSVPARFYDFTQSTGGNRETNGPNLNSRSVILGLKYLF